MTRWLGAISVICFLSGCVRPAAVTRGAHALQGKVTPVHAHLLTAEEKTELWPRLVKFWPNYDVYTSRSGRDLRVFRLDPK